MLRLTAKYKAKVETQFDGALQHLDALHREPNWREEEGLFRALSYMKRGSYKLAEAELLEAAPYQLTRLQSLYLFSRADTLYGGSNEIQRNIIAERALGMPKEPRPRA